MKIKKSRIQKIVYEEIGAYLKGLLEAPDVVDAEKDAAGKKPKSSKAPNPDDGKQDPKPEPKKAKSGPAKDQQPAAEPPDGQEQDLDAKTLEPEPKGEEEPEADDGTEDVTGSNLAKDVEGKAVQSLTMDPKSKILPGATEINIQFQSGDPLKILVTKTGAVKFFYKGSLQNSL